MNKKIVITIKKLIFTLSTVFVFSCGADDNSSKNENESDINLVTGITLKDNTGAAYAKYGNPNVLDEEIIISPNPVEDFFSIKSTADVITIWIVKGEKTILYQDADYLNILKNDLYSDDEIDALAEIKLNDFQTEVDVEENVEENDLSILSLEGSKVNSVLINTSELSTGYYRVFVKTERGTYWDNLYVSNGTLDLAQFDFFENEF